MTFRRLERIDAPGVRNQVANRRIPVITESGLKRNGLLRHLPNRPDLLHINPDLFGDFTFGRLASQPLDKLLLHTQDAIDRLDHVDRDTNRPCLVGYRTSRRLTNPPRGICREPVSATILELLNCLH